MNEALRKRVAAPNPAPWKYAPGDAAAYTHGLKTQGIRVRVLAQIPANRDGNALFARAEDQKYEGGQARLRKVLEPQAVDRYVILGALDNEIRVVRRVRLEEPIAAVRAASDDRRTEKKKPHRAAYQLRYAARKREERLRDQLARRLSVPHNSPDFRQKVEARLAEEAGDSGHTKRHAHNQELFASWLRAVERLLTAGSAAPEAPSAPAGPPAPPPERSTGS